MSDYWINITGDNMIRMYPQALNWLYLGIYLGYSETAIKKFIYVHTSPASKVEHFDDRFAGTGYLSPRDEQNDSVHDIVNRINKVRVCPIPFAPLVPHKSERDGLFVHKEMSVVADRVYLLNDQLVETHCRAFMKDMQEHPRKKWVKYVRMVANRIESESLERDQYLIHLTKKSHRS